MSRIRSVSLDEDEAAEIDHQLQLRKIGFTEYFRELLRMSKSSAIPALRVFYEDRENELVRIIRKLTAENLRLRRKL